MTADDATTDEQVTDLTARPAAEEPAATAPASDTLETAGPSTTVDSSLAGAPPVETGVFDASIARAAPPAEPVLADSSTTAEESSTPAAEPAAARRRRGGAGRRATRWLVPVVLFAIAGSAAGYAVAQPRRTDVPGLRTKPDGRYVFAPLRLPAIPRQSPAPDGKENLTGTHLVDIRTLLLRPPVGAIAVNGVADDGWMTQAAFANLHTDAASVTTQLDSYGCRHIAAREWRTPDGATTAVYLLQFDDTTLANDFLSTDTTESYTATPGAVGSNRSIGGVTANIAGTTSAHATRVARIGEFASGDTVAVVLFTAPSSVGTAPFDQILTLQAEMLS